MRQRDPGREHGVEHGGAVRNGDGAAVDGQEGMSALLRRERNGIRREVREPGADRVRRHLPQTAERGGGDDVAERLELLTIRRGAAVRWTRASSSSITRVPSRAGGALAARLVRVELGQAADEGGEILIHAEHGQIAGAEEDHLVLRHERAIEMGGRDQVAGRAAGEHRLHAVGRAAAEVDELAHRGAELDLDQTGCATSPETQTSFVPGQRSVPCVRYASAPSPIAIAAAASVSTLSMAVGRPNKPACTGSGGLSEASGDALRCFRGGHSPPPARSRPAPYLMSISHVEARCRGCRFRPIHGFARSRWRSPGVRRRGGPRR